MSETKLLPCPFCGYEAKLWTDGGGGAWAVCKSCFAQGPSENCTIDDTPWHEKWNRRAPSPDADLLRQACELLDNMTDLADAIDVGCECDSEKHNAECLQPEIERRIGKSRAFLARVKR